MIKVDLVVDLAYGSTGKGALSYLLASYLGHDTVCTAWSPNAGHTTQIATGQRYVHTQLASSMLADSVQTQLIGPGSVVNLESLINEVKAAGPLVKGKSIVVHPNACILRPRHPEAERAYVRVGSTMKGSAAAVIEKMMRDPDRSPLARDMHQALHNVTRARFGMCDVNFMVDEVLYDAYVNRAGRLLVEGAQGYSLGLHNSRFWPYCTSRDVSPAQLFADCRLPFDLARLTEVWGVTRTYPIRVANRFNDRGDLIGTSGPCYDDQQELDWQKDLDREPELTTVTKLPRRIFSFSRAQVTEACRVCAPFCITLSFCDYLQSRPAIGDRIGPVLQTLVDKINDSTNVPVSLLAFGPSITDTVILDHDGVVHWLNDANFHEYVMGDV